MNKIFFKKFCEHYFFKCRKDVTIRLEIMLYLKQNGLSSMKEITKSVIGKRKVTSINNALITANTTNNPGLIDFGFIKRIKNKDCVSRYKLTILGEETIKILQEIKNDEE